MSQTSIAGYAEAWRRRFEQKEAESRAAAEAARKSPGKAVDILRGHGATKVVLFGSLCSGSFHPRSDIDLAVEGIPRLAWTRAFADVMMALDHPVDLKPIEEVEPSFREAILRRGDVLYEKT